MKNLSYILQKFFAKFIRQIFTVYPTKIKHIVIICVPLMVYNHTFPGKEMIIKLKSFLNPSMNKGLQRSSKRKHKLYEKFLKNKTYQNEKSYKITNHCLRF